MAALRAQGEGTSHSPAPGPLPLTPYLGGCARGLVEKQAQSLSNQRTKVHK